MSEEQQIFDETEGLVQWFVRKYAGAVPEVDLEQELNLALLLMIRDYPDKEIRDLKKMAATCLYRTCVNLMRKRSGRGKPRPEVYTQQSKSIEQLDLSDPGSLASIQEAFDDLRECGHAESVVLSALVNPSDALIVTSRSKHGRVTVALKDIASHYGLGLRATRAAVRKIRERLTDLAENS